MAQIATKSRYFALRTSNVARAVKGLTAWGESRMIGRSGPQFAAVNARSFLLARPVGTGTPLSSTPVRAASRNLRNFAGLSIQFAAGDAETLTETEVGSGHFHVGGNP